MQIETEVIDLSLKIISEKEQQSSQLVFSVCHEWILQISQNWKKNFFLIKFKKKKKNQNKFNAI